MKSFLALTLSLCLLGTAVAQERVPRVGYLSWQDAGAYYDATLKGFLDGLRAQGYVDGKNVEVLKRSSSNEAERFKPLARELAAAKVDVYFAPATPMATARVGVVIDEAMRTACKQEIEHGEEAAKKLGLTLVLVHIDRPETMEAGFRKLVDAKVQAVMTTLLSTRHGIEREHAEAALKYRLPSMHELEYSARQGGLMSYGPDFEDIVRRAGHYVGGILKGGKPAEMPIEQPRQFRLVVNLKTAKAIGLTVPQSVLLRADEVIQ